jgi:hypothetical protein
LFIVFSRGYGNEPPQERRSHFVDGESWRNRKKGRSLESACLPMALVLLVRPNSNLGMSRFSGDCILHDVPEKQVTHNVSPWKTGP